MNVVKPEPSPQIAEAKAPPMEPEMRHPMLRASDTVARFASAYPTISVISAFAVGYALARLVRRLQDA